MTPRRSLTDAAFTLFQWAIRDKGRTDQQMAACHAICRLAGVHTEVLRQSLLATNIEDKRRNRIIAQGDKLYEIAMGWRE